MKKWLYIPLALIIILLVGIGVVHVYLNSLAPSYEGSTDLSCLDDNVDVFFDEYGIPHIYAKSANDAYRALGHTIGSERLFQLEMMKRVGKGQLSEVLGADFIKTDALFRSLFPPSYFEDEAERLHATQNEQLKAAVDAYLAGLNEFVESGATPFEFNLLGIEKKPYTYEDLYAIAGYMAYSFGLAQRTDPLADFIYNELGEKYIQNTGLDHENDQPFIPTYEGSIASEISQELFSMANQNLPLPLWEGSNSWVVSGNNTSSGYPIFCNDTHIAYSLPQVWYEAHLNAPDLDFYGYFLAGIPCALVGHNDFMSWGLTMLEQDDMDFYAENIDFEKHTYRQDSVDMPLEWFETSVSIKDRPDSTIVVYATHHGPLVGNFYEQLDSETPVSLWWDYVKSPNNLLEAFYNLNHCKSMAQAEEACSMIHGPGLNVTYADTLNNIAWWASAKLLERPEHVNPKYIIDGTTSQNEPLGYYTFEDNPKTINPPWNFVYSANDQPGTMLDSIFYPGYYKPNHRADRIKQWLEQPITWDIETMQQVMTDVQSDVDSKVAATLRSLINTDGSREKALALLSWDGNHEIEDKSPVLYYRLLYHTMKFMMTDEIGDQRFNNFLTTHWFKRGYERMISDPTNPWWDDITTPAAETREDIVNRAFETALSELEGELGPIENWNWGQLHTINLEHPFAEVLRFMDSEINIGPFPIRGGFETVNQAGFTSDSSVYANVRIGSQMRIIRDMGDLSKSISVTPSGQSGHFRSPHYRDQAEVYRKGQFRPELWEKDKAQAGRLWILNSK